MFSRLQQQQLHYFEIGIHKWLWNANASGNLTPKDVCGKPLKNISTQSRRVMYHDEVRIVDGR